MWVGRLVACWEVEMPGALTDALASNATLVVMVTVFTGNSNTSRARENQRGREEGQDGRSVRRLNPAGQTWAQPIEVTPTNVCTGAGVNAPQAPDFTEAAMRTLAEVHCQPGTAMTIEELRKITDGTGTCRAYIKGACNRDVCMFHHLNLEVLVAALEVFVRNHPGWREEDARQRRARAGNRQRGNDREPQGNQGEWGQQAAHPGNPLGAGKTPERNGQANWQGPQPPPAVGNLQAPSQCGDRVPPGAWGGAPQPPAGGAGRPELMQPPFARAMSGNRSTCPGTTGATRARRTGQ